VEEMEIGVFSCVDGELRVESSRKAEERARRTVTQSSRRKEHRGHRAEMGKSRSLHCAAQRAIIRRGREDRAAPVGMTGFAGVKRRIEKFKSTARETQERSERNPRPR